MIPFTLIHFILIGVSCFLLVSFIAGLVYLLFREKQKGAQARKEYLRTLLQRRRKAISGRPRGPTSSFSYDSTEEWNMPGATQRKQELVPVSTQISGPRTVQLPEKPSPQFSTDILDLHIVHTAETQLSDNL